jgi:hypothetical protein
MTESVVFYHSLTDSDPGKLRSPGLVDASVDNPIDFLINTESPKIWLEYAYSAALRNKTRPFSLHGGQNASHKTFNKHFATKLR